MRLRVSVCACVCVRAHGKCVVEGCKVREYAGVDTAHTQGGSRALARGTSGAISKVLLRDLGRGMAPRPCHKCRDIWHLNALNLDRELRQHRHSSEEIVVVETAV